MAAEIADRRHGPLLHSSSTMKTAVVLLAVLSTAAAVPFGFFRPGGYNQGGSATGSAAGNVVSGSSSGPYQNSQITQVSAQAQGSVRGNGYSNNQATASNIGISSPFGNQQFSNTNAVSNQGSFGGGFNRPYRRNHFGNFYG
ncbi:hypothetical protein FJT64_023628 [Amphibalanus amphitrite]|uniref:Uncharacterized protein n=1 Tax=Amphibalanus amphitrite TaxID=1232801 RepID=A0A6A4WEZ9_AMPAM|nr:hypothetical protein FJT64_023628 [Amphibalanus amphitrite]